MSINIPSKILTLKEQRVNQVQFDEGHKKLIFRCERDKRKAAIYPVTGQNGRINWLIKRQVRDAPIFCQPCLIEIELAQVFFNKKERQLEHWHFVDKGSYFTHRSCRLVSCLCRHMSIQAVSRPLHLLWETTKNIDKAYLQQTLPVLEPEKLSGLK